MKAKFRRVLEGLVANERFWFLLACQELKPLSFPGKLIFYDVSIAEKLMLKTNLPL